MEQFRRLEISVNNNSLLKKHFTESLCSLLGNRCTKFGGKLEQCIMPGCNNPESYVGVVASDPNAYDDFSELFIPIIKDYHNIPDNISQPDPDFGDVDNLAFKNLDSSGKFVLSTRVRVGRSQEGFGYAPVLTTKDRAILERNIKKTFESLTGEYKGNYYPLSTMSPAFKSQLVSYHYLFREDDRNLELCNVYDDWPKHRGVFFNKDKTFIVWVNEEDHLRFISMQDGGDLTQVYRRLVKVIKLIEQDITFQHHSKYGFLTMCPSNLGTTLRASVLINIPELSSRKDFREICSKLNLQVRGFYGAYTEGRGGTFDLSNKRRLGLTEIQAVTEMYEGVQEVIAIEKELQENK